LRTTHGAAIHSSTANTGIAAVRLSIRSSTPP
jgi:hypothetical protein